MREFPPEIPGFAGMFSDLHSAPQQAACALDTDASRKSDVLGHIASAERAISRFEQADVAARRSFAAHVPFRQRPSQDGPT